MKTILPLTLVVLLLWGCSSPAETTAQPDSQTQRTLVLLEPDQVPTESYALPTGEITTPSRHKAYYVGRMVDSNNPGVMREAGVIYRKEQNERWDTNPGRNPSGFGSGSIDQIKPAAMNSVPTNAEVEQILVQMDAVNKALAGQNKMLVEEIEKMKKEPQQTTPFPVQVPETVQESTVVRVGAPTKVVKEKPALRMSQPHTPRTRKGFTILKPTADGIIELDPNFFVKEEEQTNNPFVQTYQPPKRLTEVKLKFMAAMPGNPGGTIINGQPFTQGEFIRGLEIYDIDTDTIYLKKDVFLLACPVGEAGTILRLP